MGVTVRELFGKLGLDVDEASFKVADAVFDVTKKGLLGLGAVATAFGAAIAAGVKHVADQADALDEMAQRTGVGTDALQSLGYAAKFSNVSMESLEQSLKFMAKSGIKDVQGELVRLADEMSRLPEHGGARAAFAVKHLGKTGTALIPMLNKGAEGLQAFADEARAMGVVMDEKTIAAGVRLSDELDRMQFSIGGLVKTIAGPLLGPIADIVQGMREWITANRQWLATRIGAAAAILGKGLKGLWAVVRGITDAFQWMVKNWKLVAVVLGSAAIATLVALQGAISSTLLWYAALGAGAVLNALKVAAAWAVAYWPFVLMGITIALVILILEDLWTAIRGGNSVIGKLGAEWTEFLESFTKHETDDWWITRRLKDTYKLLLDLQGAYEVFQKMISGMTWKDAMKAAELAGMAIQNPLRAASVFYDVTSAADQLRSGPMASPDAAAAMNMSMSAQDFANRPAQNVNMSVNIPINGTDKNPKQIAEAVRDELNACFRQSIPAVAGGG